MFAHIPVLVVDDMAVMLDILVRNLKLLGFTEIYQASSGHEAWRQLGHRPVRLILADWSMPGMSGLELLSRVRADARLGAVPFVLVTAEMQRERVEQALRAGASDFLLKPFAPAALAAKLAAVLGGRRGTDPGPPAAAEAAYAAPAIPSVLVVDDTPNNLTLVAGLLREQYQVRLAVRGDKALALVAAAPPDLILLDIMMPGMDGFEVCRRLKENPQSAHIPVLFLSALDQTDKVVAGLALGAVDYVAKPIEPAILKARVASALRLARAHEDLRARCELMVENARLREEVEQIARHDLNNPLAAIIGLSTGLLADPALDQPQREQVGQIARAACAMLDLAHLSGDLFKIERGTYVRPETPVALAALLQRVADETGRAFGGKQIGVAVELPAAGAPTVRGDALLLYSMLHNLARNAAEASPPGATIRLSLEAGAPCRIGVHNLGEVPLPMRARFFEQHASHGKAGGSGLGTYSAALIARAHGGAIAMESDAARGTSVRITLPPV